jgi:hypothetical protein
VRCHFGSKIGTGRSDAVPSDPAPSCTISHNFRTDYAATKISSRLDLICTSMRVNRMCVRFCTCGLVSVVTKALADLGRKRKSRLAGWALSLSTRGLKGEQISKEKMFQFKKKNFFSVSSHEIWKLFVFFTIAVHVIYHL